MKKLFMILAIMFATAIFVQNVQAQSTDATTFNLSMTVDKYIETTPTPVAWDFGITTQSTAGGGLHHEVLYGTGPGAWDLGYANCPFSITVEGDNGAGQGVPRFARLEVGPHSNGWDVAATIYQIHFTTNGVSDLFYGTWLQGAHQFPYTKSFPEAPHNGQIKMDMNAYVNASIASEAVGKKLTIINPAYTWDQSLDAGLYECTMTVTVTAL